MQPGNSLVGLDTLTIENSIDQSSASAFALLGFDPDATRHIIIEATVYDPGTTTTVDMYYSDSTVYLTSAYHERMGSGLTFRSSVDLTNVIPTTDTSVGAITILLEPDDSVDPLTYYWDCRTLEAFMGGSDFARTEYGKILEAKVRDIRWTDQGGADRYDIVFQDNTLPLRKPLSQSVYAGTGEIEGGSDIKGSRKPLAFGVCKNATPALIDKVNLVYQFHDGLLESIDAVYDLGFQLTPRPTTPDVADVWATDVFSASDSENNYYITDLSKGLVRLSGEPSGLITGDIKGDATVSLDGYVNTCADIAERMARKAGIAELDIDQGSRAAMNKKNNGPVGFYLPPGDSTNAYDAMQFVMASMRGFVTSGRLGLIRFGRIGLDTSPSAVIQKEFVVSSSRLIPEPSAKTLTIKYDKSWTVQDVSGTFNADPNHVEFVLNEYRTLAAETDAATTDERLLAQEVEIETLFVNEVDAQAEQTRWFDLIKGLKSVYRFELEEVQWTLSPGQTVRIYYDKWGLDAGNLFFIRSVDEDSQRGTTIIEAWG